MCRSTLIPHVMSAIVFILSAFFFSSSLSDPRASLVDISCEDFHEDVNPEAVSAFMQLMGTLKAGITTNHSVSSTIDFPSHSVMGLVQCHQDLSQEDCLLCFSEGMAKLERCLHADAGRVYLDGCFIRYDHYNFFNESVVQSWDVIKCGKPKKDLNDPYIQKELIEKREKAIDNVTIAASTAIEVGGFGTAVVKNAVESSYGLGQCWETIGLKECRECLNNAGTKMKQCLPNADARVMNAGCFLRVSPNNFFDWRPNRKPKLYELTPGMSKTQIVFLVIIGAMILTLFSFVGACMGYGRYSDRKAQKRLVKVSSAINNSILHYKYEALEKATGKFDPSNKLGQGGGGSVFKGTLPDGKVVAVKRLFFTTRQWADEFFNEVNLIHGIHHENLVKLLGCSIEGPESLIIYEFVPNKSLNQILFDNNKTEMLSWKKRYDIIVGIAEGLAHLHGGCGTTIIHRDIKNSNILLDENLTPKIADFGLVRRASPDRTHVSTAVAGTLGYMAPEYLLRGQLTEKADVYAFGVLAIEISCGRKNNIFLDESSSVLRTVWKNYQSGKITESVDHKLNAEFQEEEASNTLQVGLLCTQTSPGLRPSMAEVVRMLKSTTNADAAPIPSPQQPPFLNSSLLNSGDDDDDDTSSKASLSETTSSKWHSSAEVIPEG